MEVYGRGKKAQAHSKSDEPKGKLSEMLVAKVSELYLKMYIYTC